MTSPLAAAPSHGGTPAPGTESAAPTDPSPTSASPTGSSPTSPTSSASSASPTASPSSASASPSPTRSATATRTSPSPRPSHARIRLATAIVSARTTNAGHPRARYTLRIGATGGTARHVVARMAVRPHGIRFTGPRACTGTGTVRCALGSVHAPRTLHFHQRGHLRSAARLTITVTTSAANAPTRKAATVLVFRPTAPRTVHRSVRHYVHVPPVTQRDVQTVPERPLGTMAPPPVTVFPTTESAPAQANVGGAPPAGPGTRARPRLPVIAPRPGPRPTPNGAPVTVRPIAEGHQLTGTAAGPPTRTILGLLAAAASFVGLVTALVLIRRRNET